MTEPIERTQTQFTCKCGLAEAWIGEGEVSPPCPACGRVYEGYYNSQTNTLEAKVLRYDKPCWADDVSDQDSNNFYVAFFLVLFTIVGTFILLMAP